MNGISLGAVYALLAIGFVIIFKATQVVNFAHGAMATVGAFTTAVVAVDLNFPGRWLPGRPLLGWLLSVLVALILSALVGMFLERVFVRPMVGEELFSLAIVTLGMNIILITVVTDLIGPDPRSMGDPWGDSVIDFGPAVVPQTEIAQVIVALVLMVLVGLFFRTRTGIAMRATAFDQEAARAQGIKVGRNLRHRLGHRGGAGDRGRHIRVRVPAPGRRLPRHRSAGPARLPRHHPRWPGFGRGCGGRGAGGRARRGRPRRSYLNQPIFGTGFSGIVPYLLMMVVLFVRPYGIFGTRGGEAGMRGRPLLHTSYAADQALMPTVTKKAVLGMFLALAVLAPFAASIPLYPDFLGDNDWMKLLSHVAIFGIGALGINLLTGVAGQVSLGHAFFMGLGAYVGAVCGAPSGDLWGLGLPMWVWLPMAGIVPALIGLAVGPAAVRVRGLYLAFATLALVFIGEWAWRNLTFVTGGSFAGRSFPDFQWRWWKEEQPLVDSTTDTVWLGLGGERGGQGLPHDAGLPGAGHSGCQEPAADPHRPGLPGDTRPGHSG